MGEGFAGVAAISLIAFDTARLDDVQILQDHSQTDKVKLTMQITAAPAGQSALSALVTVLPPDGG